MAVKALSPGQHILLPLSARATHLYVIGQPGTGKSWGLESWIMQDIASGRGVGVIDPHGDLFDHLLTRIARLAMRDPSIANRLVIVDPLDKNWTVGLNPLQAVTGIPSERLAGFLTDVVTKIWNVDAATAPRMVRLLSSSFLALIEFQLSLVNLPRFLTDAKWREELIVNSTHEEVQEYFRYEFPKGESAIHQWIGPVLNKIGPLVFDPDIRLMLSSRATINFRQVLDQNLILLINLSKGMIGEGNSALLGAFIVAHLQKAALSRADTTNRQPFFLYLDEFQNYTTSNIQDILTESRKYGLALVLAHQYLNQLSADLLHAVINTSGTMVCFRVGHQDATVLSRELFPPDALSYSHFELKFLRLGNVRFPYLKENPETPNHEKIVSLLTQQPNREFWAKRRGPYPPLKQRTLDMTLPPMTEGLRLVREHLIAYSGTRYGVSKDMIREEAKNESGEIIYVARTKRPSVTDYEEN